MCSVIEVPLSQEHNTVYRKRILRSTTEIMGHRLRLGPFLISNLIYSHVALWSVKSCSAPYHHLLKPNMACHSVEAGTVI